MPPLPIAVVGVAFSTIFVGVSETVVTSTSPSIAVIAVTELYVADALCAVSALETAVAVNTVIVDGFAANSPAALHVSTIGACGAAAAAPKSVIVMVSVAMVVVVVIALVKARPADPACVIVQPANVAGVAAHIDAPVFVTVIVVGAVVVTESGVHVTVTLAGFVPSIPTAATCVGAMASVP